MVQGRPRSREQPDDKEQAMTIVNQAASATTPRVGEIFDEVIAALTGIIERHQVTWAEYGAFMGWITDAVSQGYEIPLMLDVFLSTAVDNANAAGDGTESNVEGPFYVPDAPVLERPYVLPKREDEPGEPLVFSGTVRSTDGSPLAGAVIDVWQGNGLGEYSQFAPDVPEFNLRGRLTTDADGRFEFETVVPEAYQIPTTGATGTLLAALGRPAFRPGHIHFTLSHERTRTLTTQIYFEGDPWIDSDVVGAVKAPLITKLEHHQDTAGRTSATCSYDFVLA
jgi:catechol 1,2-dioxygenase